MALIIGGVGVWLAFFLVKDFFFFWDTVQLGSRHAHWYFEQQFQYFFLPEEIDSGHPPVFGMYLALWWLLLGKTLWVSHLAMVPFHLGVLYLTVKISRKLAPDLHPLWLIAWFFVDPMIAGHFVLVSPDVPLVFFFLLVFWGFLEQKNWGVLLGVLGLSTISMRGMMVAAGLYFWFLLWDFSNFKSWLDRAISKALLFIPGAVLALLYLYLHYHHTGWFGYHEDSPWAPMFERVGIKGMIFNVGLLGWRLIDFGRIFEWIALGILLWKLGIKTVWQHSKRWIWLFVIILTVIGGVLIQYKYLVGHRYLMPAIIAFHFLVFHLLDRLPKGKNWIWTLVFVGLLTGNLWVYPRNIAQGWDSTLAHLPYYSLRMQMIDFIEKNNISYNQIGTDFPNLADRKYIDLIDASKQFTDKDLEKNKYIFYSNVFNGFSDKELNELKEQWKVVHRLEKGTVEVILYQFGKEQ